MRDVNDEMRNEMRSDGMRHEKHLYLSSQEKLELLERSFYNFYEGASTNDVLLEVMYCGICSSDAKTWRNGNQFKPSLILPKVLGHEFFGKISDDSKHYYVWPAVNCGVCKYCVSGKENMCPSIKILGYHLNGGMSSHVLVAKSSLIEIPPSIIGLGPINVLAEPLACAINAIEKAKIQKDDTVAIIGGGTLGICLLLSLFTLYEYENYQLKIYIFEKNQSKINKSSQLCSQQGVTQLYSKDQLTENVDVVFNATSDIDAFIQGINILKNNGRFIFFSSLSSNIINVINMIIDTSLLNSIHYKELQLNGSFGHTKNNIKKSFSVLEKFNSLMGFMIEKIISLEEVSLWMNKIESGNYFRIVIDCFK